MNIDFFFQVIAFLDDLHMPARDDYGSQQCSELLRQLLDKGGWFDQRNLTWKVKYDSIVVIIYVNTVLICRCSLATVNALHCRVLLV